jgi:hypothetical protein
MSDGTGLPYPNANTPEQKYHDDGNGQRCSPNNNKHHVFDSKKDGHEKITKNKKGKKKRKKRAIPDKKDRESLYVWSVGPQWETNSVAVVSFKCCPNKKRI